MKITLKLDDELVIHGLTKRTMEEFIHIHIMEDMPPPIWCNGIMMISFAFENTEDVVREKLNGTLHYMEICYCDCPKYMQKLKRTDTHFEQKTLNMENDGFFLELTKWVKENEKLISVPKNRFV